jgi:hypothetical protein
MAFRILRPEVAGGLGENSVLDTSTHPPKVQRLHYEFADWLGDVLVETFPVFVIEKKTGEAARDAGFTGIELAPVEVSVTPEARELMELGGITQLPKFVWLKITGEAGVDDFGQLGNALLIVSDVALEFPQRAGIDHAEQEPFVGDG